MSAPKLLDFLTGVMRQSPARASSFLSTLDDATAARLLASAEAGDTRPLLKAMSEQTWGLSPARPTPEVQVQPAGRSPMSFEDRVLNDPNIRRAVDASGAQVPAGDVEALLGAYRGAAPKRGRPPRGGDPVAESIRELSRPVDQVAAESIAGQFDRATAPQTFSRSQRQAALESMRNNWPVPLDSDPEDLLGALPDMPAQHQKLIQAFAQGDSGNWLGFDYPSQAVSAVLSEGPKNWDLSPSMRSAYDEYVSSFATPPAPARPARQMELPLGEEPTGMIPYGSRGPGVPVGQSYGPDLADAVARNAVDPTVQSVFDQIGPRKLSAPAAEVPRLADDMTFDEVPPRPARAQSPAGGSRAAKVAAAATAGGAAGLGLMLSDDDEPAITSGGEADLVEESRPAPQVAATEAMPAPTVAQAPQDYSLQARALINRLNDMRRAAGGEVPEAPAMMAEINRLVAMGNQQRRDPGYSYQQADPARDPYQQARDLIAQVNQMYRQGMTPNSPEVQRIMAQVRQLQAQGDAIRNRRAG